MGDDSFTALHYNLIAGLISYWCLSAVISPPRMYSLIQADWVSVRVENADDINI